MNYACLRVYHACMYIFSTLAKGGHQDDLAKIESFEKIETESLKI